MKKELISRQFYNMGIAIILNILLFLFILINLINQPIDEVKAIENLYRLGSVIGITFAIWYIRWWFVTAKLFRPDKVSNLTEDSSPTGTKLNGDSRNALIFGIIIVFILLVSFIFVINENNREIVEDRVEPMESTTPAQDENTPSAAEY